MFAEMAVVQNATPQTKYYHHASLHVVCFNILIQLVWCFKRTDLVAVSTKP